MKCVQMFVTLEGFVKVYPLRTKGVAYDALNNFCVKVGLLLTLVTVNAKEEYGGNCDMVRKSICYSNKLLIHTYPSRQGSIGDPRVKKAFPTYY